MPIWSLTKERVEKLLAQIRDVEFEIDTLIKLSREDLWTKDLDEFINEWRTQLKEAANMRKQMASLGRRASSKLNITGKVPKRQRKAQGEDPDDSDFETKAVARKAAPVKRAQPKSTMLSPLAPLAKSKVTKRPTATSKAKMLGAKSSSDLSEDRMLLPQALDATSSFDSAPTSDLPVAPIFQNAKAAAVGKKIAPAKRATPGDGVDEEEVDEDVIRPVASRKPREAAKKVPTYNLDDSDSNGDDMLLDVGKMVKGIGGISVDQATTTRPLFSTSMSRPGSSAGLPKKSSSLAKQPLEIDGDDTDYSKLAPPPAAKRALSVTGRRTVISDDDDDNDDEDEDEILPISRKPPPSKAASISKAPKSVAAKPAAKATAKAKAKASTKQPVSQPAKKMPLSPAAKAYAAKHAKDEDTEDFISLNVDSEDEKVVEDDDVERVANAILDDDDNDDGGNGKDELEREREDEADEDEPVVRRPARRAAAQAAAKVTKGWRDESEEDDEDEDEDDFHGDDDSE